MSKTFLNPEYNDPGEAFERAIQAHRLSDNPHSRRFAGNFMYMGTWSGRDQFKHIQTREYLASGQQARPRYIDTKRTS